jgi:hypothetical protein
MNGNCKKSFTLVEGLHAKLFSCPGPSVFLGLKCGRDNEKDTASGHLSGSWNMKFEAVRNKIESAATALNEEGWKGLRQRRAEEPQVLFPAPRVPAQAVPANVPPVTQQTLPAADVPGSEPGAEHDTELEKFMRKLALAADVNGILTSEVFNREAAAHYPTVNPHGLTGGKRMQLLAQKWVRRVREGEGVALQIEVSFLREQNLPVTFTQRHEVPRATRVSRKKIDTTGSSKAPATITPNAPSVKEEKHTQGAEVATKSVTSNNTQEALKTMRTLTERRAVLADEIRKRETELTTTDAEIKRLTESLSREELLEFILTKT